MKKLVFLFIFLTVFSAFSQEKAEYQFSIPEIKAKTKLISALGVKCTSAIEFVMAGVSESEKADKCIERYITYLKKEKFGDMAADFSKRVKNRDLTVVDATEITNYLNQITEQIEMIKSYKNK